VTKWREINKHFGSYAVDIYFQACPTPIPSSKPSSSPTKEASTQPSVTESYAPTNYSDTSNTPSSNPTLPPTSSSSSSPSSELSVHPTDEPSGVPTNKPSSTPTQEPSSALSNNPTEYTYCSANAFFGKTYFIPVETAIINLCIKVEIFSGGVFAADYGNPDCENKFDKTIEYATYNDSFAIDKDQFAFGNYVFTIREDSTLTKPIDLKLPDSDFQKVDFILPSCKAFSVTPSSMPSKKTTPGPTCQSIEYIGKRYYISYRNKFVDICIKVELFAGGIFAFKPNDKSGVCESQDFTGDNIACSKYKDNKGNKVYFENHGALVWDGHFTIKEGDSSPTGGITADLAVFDQDANIFEIDLFFPSCYAPSTPPTISPSSVPSLTKSDLPSSLASTLPTKLPSNAPSKPPSAKPSSAPSDIPSRAPSFLPFDKPSDTPSDLPSAPPSFSPSDIPSFLPSNVPTMFPSRLPSSTPSRDPSSLPSVSPTSTCPISEFAGRSFFFQMLNACYKIEIYEGGHLYADINDKDCSNPQIDTSRPLSHFSNALENKAIFSNNKDPNKWSGRFIVVEDSIISSESIEISLLNFDTMKFEMLLKTAKCVQAPSMSPSSLATNLPSVSSIPSYVPTRESSSHPSSTPSLIPSVLPSSSPSSSLSYNPSTSPSSTCAVTEFMGRTFTFVLYNACWTFDFFKMGDIKVDYSDTTCSKTTSSLQYKFSEFDSTSASTPLNKFYYKLSGEWEGYIEIIEDNESSQENMIVQDFNLFQKEFQFSLRVPKCIQAPSQTPTNIPSSSGKPSLLPSTAPSSEPSSLPSVSPSSQPSAEPSLLPSTAPSSPPNEV
jgi:hypothetical protein